MAPAPFAGKALPAYAGRDTRRGTINRFASTVVGRRRGFSYPLMPMKQTPEPNMVIGACEWVALPDLGIDRLRARVDTGAKSCALHASDIEAFERDGRSWVRFRVHMGHPEPNRWLACEAPLRAVRRVRNTSGEMEDRYTIRTTIVIGHSRWAVDITLTNRERMNYRMLLGRKAMENHALIYPARTFLQGKPRLD